MSQQVLKNVFNSNIVLHALPSGIVSCYVTVWKKEIQQKSLSQVGNEAEQFL